MQTEKNTRSGAIARRTLLKGAGGLAFAIGTVQLAGRHAVLPQRMVLDASTLPDIQFDIGAFIAAAQTVNDGGGNVTIQLPPVHTVFVTATLSRTPTTADQQNLSKALATIEATYPFAASGILTFIAYGIPYFRRLPGSLVSSHMPRLASDTSRFALEEAVAGPTDVSPANPGITKQKFNVPVKIEGNDLLITVRSDNSTIISDVLGWLGGSNKLKGQSVPSPALFKGLVTVTSSRAMFVGVSLPRNMAETHRFSYSQQINSDSPMWMGFLDQHTNGAGPAAICTFAGNSSARLTTARAGDYFDNGSIQHLSHVIQDLAQFYALPSSTDTEGEPYTERVQYMFRSNPIPSTGNSSNQFNNGGGPAYLRNVFQGTNDAANNAKAINTFQGEHRMGHLSGLQRSSRGRRDAHTHADGRPRPGQHGRTRRIESAQAAVHHVLPDRRVLPGDARQPGLARPRAPVRGGRLRQRPGAFPHRHPPAELPDPAPPAPRLPPRGTRLIPGGYPGLLGVTRPRWRSACRAARRGGPGRRRRARRPRRWRGCRSRAGRRGRTPPPGA
jgi:hypothetical protein